MPNEAATRPAKVSHQPVRSLAVEVTAGPDQGTSLTAQSETLSIGSAKGNDLTLTDATVSRYHVELTRQADGILVCDHGSTNGTAVGQVQIQRAVVPAGTSIALGHTRVRVSDGENVLVDLLDDDRLGDMRGTSAIMRRLMAKMATTARSDVPVLIVGESGTGKQLAAEALHTLGTRSGEPFVSVDCGALTPTLVASHLFGHERGAFTGATARSIGAFESAGGGTVLLDEIGELPTSLQPTLLGVLERRTFRRVGGHTDIPLSARVVSATHHDLRADVNAGTFRLDLYYRLAVVTLRLAPLRERSVDIPILIEHFLREAGVTDPVESLFSAAAMNDLLEHQWPGNVRELRNLIEASVATGESPVPDKHIVIRGDETAGGDDPIERVLDLPYRDARSALLHAFETRYLARLVARNGHNVSRASREAKMDRSHLADLLKRHNLG